MVEAVKTIFGFLKYLSPIEWLQWWRPTLWPAATELYVVACLLIEFVVAINITKIAGWPSWLPYVVLVLASLRILTIVRVTMSVVLFDEGEVASVQRTFILAAINFLELCLCYGLFYALNKKLLLGDQIGALTGFYFSFITQLTIGFGDVHPVGWLRVVAVIQGLTAALFILLVFGTIVASLRPLKSEKDKPI